MGSQSENYDMMMQNLVLIILKGFIIMIIIVWIPTEELYILAQNLFLLILSLLKCSLPKNKERLLDSRAASLATVFIS